MQIDSALQAMIDKSKQKTSGQTGPSYAMGTSVNLDLSSQPMGSNEFACGAAAPFLIPQMMCQWNLEWIRGRGSHQIRLSNLKVSH